MENKDHSEGSVNKGHRKGILSLSEIIPFFVQDILKLCMATETNFSIENQCFQRHF